MTAGHRRDRDSTRLCVAILALVALGPPLAGAVHEAHEGVLFIDEMATLGDTQRFILTAMQEKKFPITGRNPTSAGASVRRPSN